MSTINPTSSNLNKLYQQRSFQTKQPLSNSQTTTSTINNADTITIKGQKNSPNTKTPMSDYNKEKDSYQKDLESFRSVEEVRAYQSSKLEYYLSELDKVHKNTTLGEEQKEELLNKLTSRLLGIIEENEKFSRSGRFSELRAMERQDKIKDLEKKAAAEMKALKEQFESAQESAKAAAKEAEIRAKCLVIASRIISGDEVPKEDYQFLSKHNSELFAMAITYRREKEDPEKHKRLSEDEEDSKTVTTSSSVDVSRSVDIPQESPPTESSE